jgi:hypothetical protein
MEILAFIISLVFFGGFVLIIYTLFSNEPDKDKWASNMDMGCGMILLAGFVLLLLNVFLP